LAGILNTNHIHALAVFLVLILVGDVSADEWFPQITRNSKRIFLAPNSALSAGILNTNHIHTIRRLAAAPAGISITHLYRRSFIKENGRRFQQPFSESPRLLWVIGDGLWVRLAPE